MKQLIIISIITFIFLTNCKNNSKENQTSNFAIDNKKDNLHHLDSELIEQVFKRYPSVITNKENVRLFYKKRGYQFAWINKNEFNDSVVSVINLIMDTTKQNDTSVYTIKLKKLHFLMLNKSNTFKSDNNLSLELELLLTIRFFDYAKQNWGNENVNNLKTVDWFIKRKKINYEQLLDSIINHNNAKKFTEPVYRQYSLLKEYLKKYNRIEKNGGWPLLNFDITNLKISDSSLLVSKIKKQLFLTEDLKQNDSTMLFNTKLEKALIKFQSRFGLKEDGTLNEETKNALSISVHERIQQILINMERCKWVPIKVNGDYLVVNIPEFKLHVYHDNNLQWNCKVIVGNVKPIHNSIIFNDTLEYIVFSPYWNIPENIILKEIIPAIKKNSNYLNKHHLEIVNLTGKIISSSSIKWNNYTRHFPYIIRQKPGKNNALGLVKFLFPNSYDIYLHDTPSKSLFEETIRTFSHGCIRIAEPFRLAQFLLQNDSSYTEERINKLMNSDKQTFVKLKTTVPVFIAYFTSWVDRDGKLNFRKDIYNHDEKMKKLLFVK